MDVTTVLPCADPDFDAVRPIQVTLDVTQGSTPRDGWVKTQYNSSVLAICKTREEFKKFSGKLDIAGGVLSSFSADHISQWLLAAVGLRTEKRGAVHVQLAIDSKDARRVAFGIRQFYETEGGFHFHSEQNLVIDNSGMTITSEQLGKPCWLMMGMQVGPIGSLNESLSVNWQNPKAVDFTAGAAAGIAAEGRSWYIHLMGGASISSSSGFSSPDIQVLLTIRKFFPL